MVKYSIITPLYNSFDLMTEYFDSLSSQTFNSFEVIVVDDCSTDESWKRLNDFAKSSSLNICCLQTPQNSGPGVARNVGIDAANGEYITFVDNDDWVDVNFLKRIDETVERENVNCVIYDYNTWLDGKIGKSNSMYIQQPGRKTTADCIKSVRNHTFGKVYKLELCKNIKFPPVRRCEDVAYVAQAIEACGNAYYLNEPLYYYRQRPTSLSNNVKMDHSDMVNAFSILEDRFLEKYPLEMKNKSVTDILYGALLMMCKSGKKRSFIVDYINEYERKYPEWWNCEIINYLGKPKQAFLKCAKWRCVMGLKLISFAHSLMIKKGG